MHSVKLHLQMSNDSFRMHPLYVPLHGDDDMVLETDASDLGAGSCLKGVDSVTRNEYIIGYTSNKFSDTEVKWIIFHIGRNSLLYPMLKVLLLPELCLKTGVADMAFLTASIVMVHRMFTDIS